ncbi:MAG: phage major capsid protein [Anaerovoracaceae bacterium]|jgi:HK97 family phage major capsid protein
MKDKLLKMLAAKNETRTAQMALVDASESVEELRALQKEIETLDEEIRNLQDMIDSIKEDDPDKRTAIVNGNIPGIVVSGAKEKEERNVAGMAEDRHDTLEYRQAFMDYVVHGTEMPTEYRDSDAFTGVADAAAVIPTTIMTDIIKEMKVRGHIYAKCRHTNVKGGVRYPILSLKPVATRIPESTPSARKKIEMDTYVSFGYLGLECKVATSLLASAVTLAMFEAQIVPLIVDAMIAAIEREIFNGNGSTEMKGILNDSRVQSEQKITLKADEFGEWDVWKKKVFAKVPLAHRNYEIFMGAGTFEGYIDGMVDANGQPIGRTNYGISDGPVYRFGGKNVVEVEEDVLPSYDNADINDVVAVFVDLGEYAINSNMQMAMYRWLDHDTNQWVDKAILINDGKLLDPAGVIIVKKGA